MKVHTLADCMPAGVVSGKSGFKHGLLSLLYDEQAAAKYVEQLRKAPVSEFKAKDIFRASNLSLLGVSNSHVDHDQKKLLAGKSLSPLLLVRATSNQTAIIADGYHRMCAVYSFDEDALIPCKIV